MILEEDIIKGRNNENMYFINTKTGAKLILEIKDNKGKLVEGIICEADIEREYLESGMDIRKCKGLHPTQTDINLFNIFMQEYINGKEIEELKNIKIV